VVKANLSGAAMQAPGPSIVGSPCVVSHPRSLGRNAFKWMDKDLSLAGPASSDHANEKGVTDDSRL
jgi:hypothetical protein